MSRKTRLVVMGERVMRSFKSFRRLLVFTLCFDNESGNDNDFSKQNDICRRVYLNRVYHLDFPFECPLSEFLNSLSLCF